MADGGNGTRVKQEQAPNADREGTREVWVTSGGIQPPQLPKSSVTVTGVRAFLSAYGLHKMESE